MYLWWPCFTAALRFYTAHLRTLTRAAFRRRDTTHTAATPARRQLSAARRSPHHAAARRKAMLISAASMLHAHSAARLQQPASQLWRASPAATHARSMHLLQKKTLEMMDEDIDIAKRSLSYCCWPPRPYRRDCSFRCARRHCTLRRCLYCLRCRENCLTTPATCRARPTHL